MKTLFSGIREVPFLLSLLLLFTMTGCIDRNSPAQENQQQLSNAGQNVNSEIQEELSDEKLELMSALSSFAPEEYIEVSAHNDKTTVILFDPELGDEMLQAKNSNAAPDGWEDLQDEVISASTDIDPLPETDHVLIYVKDSADGNIYLTVLDGSVAYDAFDGSEPVVYNEPTISLDEFNQIATGMTYDEVVKIIGGPGEILSQTDLGMGDEYASVMYMWDGEGSIGANVNVMFQGGEVVSKAQFGLE